VKQKKKENENFLISSVKGVQITVTQDFLSEALKIPNEGKKLFSCSWFDDFKVDQNQLIAKYTKENFTFNSTNLVDVPKILHNMIRHTLVPKYGYFDVVSDMDLCIIHHLMNKTKLYLCFIIIQHIIDSCLAIKQSVAGLPYRMHLTPIFQKANVPLEGEKRKLDFMKFTSKTLGQLRITTTNMPSFTTSGTSGSIKKPSSQNVQKTRKKRKIEEIKDQSPKKADVRPSSPPALELSSKVAELAREIVEDGNTQFNSLIGTSVAKENAQQENEAYLPKEAMDTEKAVETHEGVPQTAKENSFDGNHRVEQNNEKKAQNVDEETQEVAELLASNMSREEPAQDEPTEFSTGFDLNIEDFTSDFNNEVFQDIQEITQNVQEIVEPEV